MIERKSVGGKIFFKVIMFGIKIIVLVKLY